MEKYDLEGGPSTNPDAGMGLFTTKQVKPRTKYPLKGPGTAVALFFAVHCKQDGTGRLTETHLAANWDTGPAPSQEALNALRPMQRLQTWCKSCCNGSISNHRTTYNFEKKKMRCHHMKATVQAALDETVGTLKRRAQVALGVGTGRLLDSSGCVLEGCVLIKKSRVQNGDSLILLGSNTVQIQATNGAFAAILDDGSVVTWGNAAFGADSSAVQTQLKNVQQIQASYGAFAAILDDGSVVTWGHDFFGVDSSSVQTQLKNVNVQQIQASNGAFAAIVDDGSVVTWGNDAFGADSSTVQTQLKKVQQIQASAGAFAAILDDGSVVTWGNDEFGADGSTVQTQLKKVQQIQASNGAFAAVLDDGSVVTWGDAFVGVLSSTEQTQLKNVQQIQASYGAFAAILDDGSVVAWGSVSYGADSSAVQAQLKNVQQIQASNGAFAAILDDGSVVTWGNDEYGADSSAVQTQLKTVQQIQASNGAFAAILDDGSVVTWGNDFFGADSSAVETQLKNVQQIQASAGAFAAILEDGTVVTWGKAAHGGIKKTHGGTSGAKERRIQTVAATVRRSPLKIWASALFRGLNLLRQNLLPQVGLGRAGPKKKAREDLLAQDTRRTSVIHPGDDIGAELENGPERKKSMSRSRHQHSDDDFDQFSEAEHDDATVPKGSLSSDSGGWTPSFAGRSEPPNTYVLAVEFYCPDETVNALGRRAQIVLGVGKGRLMDSSGGSLDGYIPIKKAKIQDGDSLTLQVSRSQVQATGRAFVAVLGDGSLVTWGSAAFGGDCSAVKARLGNVQHVQASGGAFAAILGDGSVATWGHAGYGGDSSAVQEQLKTVQQVQASNRAFAAILSDGSVVTWGHAGYGGDCSAVQGLLKNVQQIQASDSAFAAVLGDGSVVTWGDADCGGDSSAVQGQLKTVQQVQASGGAFAAILGDGSVVTWGSAGCGGDSSAVQFQLKTVQQVQASGGAFAAILGDGSILTWGDAEFGGDSSEVRDQLKNVQKVQATDGAFAAILGDGSVVAWGDADCGGDSSEVQDQLKNVLQVQTSGFAFSAILNDGSVVTWGDADCGGDSRAVQHKLKNVRQVQATPGGAGAFAALLGDGSVVAWGTAKYGGDCSAVQAQLKNVEQIQSSGAAFAAILGDGSMVTWGDPDCGDDDVDGEVAIKRVAVIERPQTADEEELRGPLRPVADGRRLPSRPPTVPLTSSGVQGLQDFFTDEEDSSPLAPKQQSVPRIPLAASKRPQRGEANEPKLPTSASQSFLSDSDSDAKSPPARSSTMPILMEEPIDLSTSPIREESPIQPQSPLQPHSADLQLAPAQAQSREMRFPAKSEARALPSSREDSPKRLVTLQPLPEVSLFVDAAEATHPPPTPQFDVSGSSALSPALRSWEEIGDLGSSPSEAAATTTASLGVASRSIASNGSPRSPFSEETQDLSPSPLKRQLEELEEQQRQIQSSLTQADEVARCHSLTAELLEALETERRRHSEDIRAWELRLQTQLHEHEAKWLSEVRMPLARAVLGALLEGDLEAVFAAHLCNRHRSEMPPKIPAWVAAKARAGVKARAAPKARPEAKAKAKAKAKAAARSAPAAAGAKRKAAPREAAPSKVRRAASADNVGKAKAERSTAMKSGGGGKKVVDKLVPGAGGFKVYEDYSVKLNQTNVDGNNNKYYIIQLLTGHGEYHTWNRWGRVGESGQTKFQSFSDVGKAIKDFEKKFRDKTCNAWENRDDFKKKAGKYIIVETEEGEGGGDAAPMGKLTEAQIGKGQTALGKIEYYSLIPQDFGRKRPPSINTIGMLEQQQELLKFFLRMGFEEVECDKSLSPVEGGRKSRPGPGHHRASDVMCRLLSFVTQTTDKSLGDYFDLICRLAIVDLLLAVAFAVQLGLSASLFTSDSDEESFVGKFLPVLGVWVVIIWLSDAALVMHFGRCVNEASTSHSVCPDKVADLLYRKRLCLVVSSLGLVVYLGRFCVELWQLKEQGLQETMSLPICIMAVVMLVKVLRLLTLNSFSSWVRMTAGTSSVCADVVIWGGTFWPKLLLFFPRVMELPLPSSLGDAAGSVAHKGSITESNSKAVTLAKKQAGKPNRKMTEKEYAAIMLYTSNAIYKDLNQALLTVEVGLLSGKTATVEAAVDEEVEALRLRAQTALGVGQGRLLDSSGNVLDVCASIKDARVLTGDLLTLHLGRVQIQANRRAFAAILGDGSLATWGADDAGGDSSAARGKLKNVQQIQSSGRAFAAILGDRSVVTWGDYEFGGDSSAVQERLQNVQQIQASFCAFAAVLGDGSVVTWGDADLGGDSSAVQDQLKNVQQVQASSYGFAAILGEGYVVTWGRGDLGGDSRAVQDQLKSVQYIQASGYGFAAVLRDGSVVTWGDADSSVVQHQLKTVQHIQASSSTSFAAILADASVITWGDAEFGGDSRAVQDKLKNVQQIQASSKAFAAILADGSVVTWGDADFGGDSSAVQDRLQNVKQVQASDRAFSAVLGDGSVATWGDAEYGGDDSAVQDQLKNVRQIQASYGAFAAILSGSSVVTWGNAGLGGDSSAVQDQLQTVQHIQASYGAFAAILDDGSIVTWGDAEYGGDSRRNLDCTALGYFVEFGGDGNRGKLKKYFKYLRLFFESMNALPKQKRKLWRGLSVDLHSNPQYKVGGTVVWWGISSCTSDQNVAKNFAKGCGGKCTVITVESKTASDISQVTFYSNEKESLLSPGTELKVKSNKMSGNVCEITLEVEALQAEVARLRAGPHSAEEEPPSAPPEKTGHEKEAPEEAAPPDEGPGSWILTGKAHGSGGSAGSTASSLSMCESLWQRPKMPSAPKEEVEVEVVAAQDFYHQQ
ncbi:Poly [ADP-ribose] polymerase 3 [Symbiodinium microadriaticum]|uniref:Poly [ADP-ribose] polymerase 3 n=2 Tax=Symbiodinium TaxID=2949 RepID=A0A1Q9E4B2_SYMMI|nr:Poly [ADP-ribose] polymerase 3 [Symbiodinium microadriaticum]